MRITVRIVLRMEQCTALTQKLDDLWIRLRYGHPGKSFDIACKSSGRIDRCIDVEAVFFGDMKVVAAVAGSRVNAAGT